MEIIDDGNIYGGPKAPEILSFGKTISVGMFGSSFSLSPGEIVINIHFPQVVSVGLPFVIAELKDQNSLFQARLIFKRI